MNTSKYKNFLEYAAANEAALDSADSEIKARFLIEIAKVLTHQLENLAEIVAEGQDYFFTCPVLCCNTDYNLQKHGATQEDCEVFEMIQGYLQNCSFYESVLDYQVDTGTALSNRAVGLRHDHMKLFEAEGLEIFIQMHSIDEEDEDAFPSPTIYISLGGVVIRI